MVVEYSRMQEALRGLLSQPQALAIVPISFEVFSHPQKDPGCRKRAEEALKRAQLPHSSRIFRELAESVSLQGCEDDAFQLFRQILQEWFSPSWQQ